jgi:hypothetical protein
VTGKKGDRQRQLRTRLRQPGFHRLRFTVHCSLMLSILRIRKYRRRAHAGLCDSIISARGETTRRPARLDPTISLVRKLFGVLDLMLRFRPEDHPAALPLKLRIAAL